MNRLGFILDSRGIRNSIARARQVTARFGVTASRMEKRLSAYADLLEDYGSHPSFPITAVVLNRNPRVAHRLADRGVELCVHGFVHTDLSKLSPDVQKRHIKQATRVFRDNGIEFHGFRSPYLRYNAETLNAVAALDFEYDSNLPFYWDVEESLGSLKPHEADGLSRGLRFYEPVRFPDDRSLPRFIGELVEIPVSLPDDEILLDRMGLPPLRIGEIWEAMARSALQRGELLTIQLHPERILLLDDSLRQVLDFARSSGEFWITTLAEIAAWWKEQTRVQVGIAAAGPGKYRVALPPGLRSQLHLVEPGTGARHAVEADGDVVSALRPVIGASPDVDGDLIHGIRDLRYVIEFSENSEEYPVYLDRSADLATARKHIANLDHLLLADSSWPRPFKAALTVTGDIDCLTLGDFIRRFRED